MSLAAFADSDKERKEQPKPLSIFNVIPLNSPVKESIAKFLFKTPTGFEIDKVKYRIKNAGKIFDKDMPHQEINLVSGPQGNELHIPVSKLPPGFYRLYVLVVDKKDKKEQQFKSAYHDHVRFVIDETLQVPMPDSKKNEATVGGVDSDNDGIRDDVQRYINENYSSSLKTKLAAKQHARNMQSYLLTTADKEKSIVTIINALWSKSCLGAIVGDEKAANIGREIKGKYLNTKDRLYADMQGNQNFSGQAYELIVGEEQILKCEFDPATLQN